MQLWWDTLHFHPRGATERDRWGPATLSAALSWCAPCVRGSRRQCLPAPAVNLGAAHHQESVFAGSSFAGSASGTSVYRACSQVWLSLSRTVPGAGLHQCQGDKIQQRNSEAAHLNLNFRGTEIFFAVAVWKLLVVETTHCLPEIQTSLAVLVIAPCCSLGQVPTAEATRPWLGQYWNTEASAVMVRLCAHRLLAIVGQGDKTAAAQEVAASPPPSA